MKIWLIEVKVQANGKLKGGWHPIPDWYPSERAALKILKEEWPEGGYARVSEYARKGKK